MLHQIEELHSFIIEPYYGHIELRGLSKIHHQIWETKLNISHASIYQLLREEEIGVIKGLERTIIVSTLELHPRICMINVYCSQKQIHCSSLE